MFKKLLLPIASLLLAAGVLAGCTPKATSIWCPGLGENSGFSFDYVVIDSVFDGWTRIFSVKNTEYFEEFLTRLDDYAGTIQKADSSDSAFIFLSNGQKFYCAATGDGYVLSPCALCVYQNGAKYDLPFPPATDNYIQGDDTSIEIVQPWDYFVAFYQEYSNVTIIGESKQIITDLYSADEIVGKAILTYTDGEMTYELNTEI